MNPFSVFFPLALFVGMLVLLEFGRRLGLRHKGEEGARPGLGAVEGAVFALMGLLIAFTFSGAATRFDTRRQLIIDEANAIGTAWLRIDLMPTAAQPELRDLFRRYFDARLEAYRKVPDMAAVRAELDRAGALQGQLWARAAAACREVGTPIPALLLPALNQMFDVGSSRTAASQIHPPTIIFIMLGVLALMSSLLAGYAMAGGKGRSWIHMLGFAAILATTVYVILDLEFPRLGLIRIERFDQMLVDLRRTMN